MCNRAKAGGVLSLALAIIMNWVYAQKDFNGPPLFIDVNGINLVMKKVNGEGQFSSQYSWMLTGNDREQTEIFYYPQDEWHSQMLYQIFNPVSPDDSGFVDNNGERRIIPTPFVSDAKNDFSWEIRRYRPPYVQIDGIPQRPAYTWEVDPNSKSDLVAVWEDVMGHPSNRSNQYWGIRIRIEVYAFSNPNHDNYLIWKASYKFTGETRLPRENPGPDDFFPDQTMRLWWPLSFSLGPSKGGEYAVQGSFPYEAVDDLDSWFAKESQLVTDRSRDSLKIAYYWDYKFRGISPYSNGSTDDSGDPDRVTGFLISRQIPGFALLHAAKNSFHEEADDVSQPYSMPHATILDDLWNRRDFGLRDTYIGHDDRGRWPLDPITMGWMPADGRQYGPMRFITIGPYELTKKSAQGVPDTVSVIDSLCAVYAIGAGSLSWEAADSIGRGWLNGEISDSAKYAYYLTAKDSLFQTMDRAYWAWDRGLDIPDPPPPPDVEVTSDADRVIISWSYPEERYWKDPDTDVDDWYAWRVYRKEGASWVHDPGDRHTHEKWEMIYETTDKSTTTYVDSDVVRGVSYYYAVTSVDDGSQNVDGIVPGQKLESSRYVNRSLLPAIPFKAGLSVSDRVVVVPNPATVQAGALGFPGELDQILFTNLPYSCDLRIFTETGDLITRMGHRGTDQEVWNQRNDDNQYVASGLYVLAVTQAKSVGGESLPDQFVKFTIIR